MYDRSLTYPVDISISVRHSSSNETLNSLDDPLQVQLSSEDVHQFSHFCSIDETGFLVEVINSF